MTPEPSQSVRRETIRRFGLALLLAALGGLLQWAIEPLAGGHIPFLLFLPAIMVTAVYAGPWPAALVAALGAIHGTLVLRQGGPLMLQTHPAAWAALAYAVLVFGLLWLGRRLYFTNRRATAAERRLRTAEDDAAVGLFEIDVANDTLFASSGFWQLIGRDPLVGAVPLSAWLRVLHPEDVAEARELMARPPAKLRTEIEHRVLLPDGSVRWVMTRMRGEAARDGEQERTRYVRGVMVDITQRKQAAEALAATRSELEQRVVDLSEVHELTGRLETCEDLTEQLKLILGTLARLHGAGKGVVSLVQPDGKHLKLAANIGLSPAALERMAVVPVGVGACGLVCQHQQRVYVEDVDTDERFVRSRDFARAEGFRAVHGTPLFDHAGHLLGAITIHMPEPAPLTDRELRVADICSRKAAVLIERARAEELASEHDRRFRSVLDASAAGFIVLRPVRDEGGLIRDFIWVYANSAAAGSWQRTPEQLMGRTVNETMPGAC